MATFNGEPYLREQLESLAAQKRLPQQLVVCDDGSSDGTLQILEAFAEKAPFPVLVFPNQHRLGYTRNFLRAVRQCSGDWVSLCDQDDVWRADKLAVVERAILSHPDTAMAVHRAEVVGHDLSKTGNYFPNLPKRGYFAALHQPLSFRPPGFCCTFDRRLISQIRIDRIPNSFFSPKREQGHDKLITWLANVMGGTVIIHETLAQYRRHETNASQLLNTARPRPSPAASIEFDRFRRDVSNEYSKELIEIMEKSPDEFGDALINGASYYKRMSGWYSLRLCLRGHALGERITALARLILQGAYFGGKGATLGGRALLRDLAIAFVGQQNL